jgi:hypothetical protein
MMLRRLVVCLPLWAVWYAQAKPSQRQGLA